MTPWPNGKALLSGGKDWEFESPWCRNVYNFRQKMIDFGVILSTTCLQFCFFVFECYRLLFAIVHFIKALPLLNTILPPSTDVMNLTSSQPALNSPVLQASVTSLSPGFTGAANLA